MSTEWQRDAPQDDLLAARFERLRQRVIEWLASYNAYGKTFADFDNDFRDAPCVAEFRSMLERVDLPEDLKGRAHDIWIAIDDLGFLASTRAHRETGQELGPDDLILPDPIPGGLHVCALARTAPRAAAERLLADVEHGNGPACRFGLTERLAHGRFALDRLDLAPSRTAWAMAELERIASGAQNPDTTPP